MRSTSSSVPEHRGVASLCQGGVAIGHLGVATVQCCGQCSVQLSIPHTAPAVVLLVPLVRSFAFPSFLLALTPMLDLHTIATMPGSGGLGLSLAQPVIVVQPKRIRIKQEDGYLVGTQDGRQARRTLESLSDELLTRIFWHVYISYMAQNLDDRRLAEIEKVDTFIPSGIIAPLGYTTLNKRIYRLTYGLWMSTMTINEDDVAQDRIMTGILIRSLAPGWPTTQYITEFNGYLSSSSPQLQCTTFMSLRNLRRLIITFWSSANTSEPLPPAFLAVLPSFRHLEYLRLREFDGISEGSPVLRLDQHLSSLQTLEIDGKGIPVEWHGSLGNLKHLTMRYKSRNEVAAHLGTGIPWTTLESLVVDVKDLWTLKLLEVEVMTASMLEILPLKHLEINVPSVRKADFGKLKNTFESLFLNLCKTRLSSMHISHFDRLPAEMSFVLCGVKTLTIDTSEPVVDEDRAARLAVFVRCFPDVQVVRIAYTNWIDHPRSLEDFVFFDDDEDKLGFDDDHTAESMSLLPSHEFAFAYPHWLSFLFELLWTEVREVRYRARLETVEMRWTREGARGPLEAEKWHVG
ncbi:Proteophosphoglycan ppg4 [Rhodotorula toruloides]|nr:Proteophosphoglycan ppg4 [Rhodotorula toruloides]